MMFEEYTCSVVRHLMAQGGQLIDVRSTLEFAQGSLRGADNIPVETLEYLAPSIKKDRPVLLFSRFGERAEIVKYRLIQLGYPEIHNIGSYHRYKDCMVEEVTASA